MAHLDRNGRHTPASLQTPDASAQDTLADRVRAYLCGLLPQDAPVTYQALAKTLQVPPPNTISQLTVALEDLITEDAAAGHPLIAAMVISRLRGGLPAPGFFESARRSGRHFEDPASFHAAELDASLKYWCTCTPVAKDR